MICEKARKGISWLPGSPVRLTFQAHCSGSLLRLSPPRPERPWKPCGLLRPHHQVEIAPVACRHASLLVTSLEPAKPPNRGSLSTHTPTGPQELPFPKTIYSIMAARKILLFGYSPARFPDSKRSPL